MKNTTRTLTLAFSLTAVLCAQQTAQPARDADHPVPPDVASISRKLSSEYISIADTGAKCDSRTDDTEAIRAGIRQVQKMHAGVLHGMAGVCMISSGIIIPGGVRFIGFMTVKAASNFSSPSGMLALGDPALPMNRPIEFSSIEDMGVDCNSVPGCIPITSTRAQEQCFIARVTFVGFLKTGIELSTLAVQNFHMYDLWGAPSKSATAATCIHLSQAASRIGIRDVTCDTQSHNDVQNAPAILIENNSQVAIDNVHLEHYAVGIEVSSGALATVRNYFGNYSLPTMVRFTPSAGGGAVYDLVAAGSKITIQDQMHSPKAGVAETVLTAGSDFYLPQYIAGFKNKGATVNTGAFRPIASPNNPGCRTAEDEGKIWINNATPPSKLELCLSTGSGFVWMKATLTPGM